MGTNRRLVRQVIVVAVVLCVGSPTQGQPESGARPSGVALLNVTRAFGSPCSFSMSFARRDYKKSARSTDSPTVVIKRTSAWLNRVRAHGPDQLLAAGDALVTGDLESTGIDFKRTFRVFSSREVSRATRVDGSGKDISALLRTDQLELNYNAKNNQIQITKPTASALHNMRLVMTPLPADEIMTDAMREHYDWTEMPLLDAPRAGRVLRATPPGVQLPRIEFYFEPASSVLPKTCSVSYHNGNVTIASYAYAPIDPQKPSPTWVRRVARVRYSANMVSIESATLRDVVFSAKLDSASLRVPPNAEAFDFRHGETQGLSADALYWPTDAARWIRKFPRDQKETR